jgi:hypothetical protein
MRSFLFNPGSVRAGKRISGKGLLKTFLMAGILITSLPETGSAQGPVFYNGGSYSKIVCNNAPIDLGDYLKVSYPYTGTITWSVVVPPSNGALGGFPATADGPASTLMPVGATYTPDPGATFDNFTIMADDGTTSAVISIHFDVNTAPTLTLGAFPSVCKGVTNAVIPFSNLTNVGPDTVIFNYTGARQSWTVPANVTGVQFDLMGASGGNDYLSGVSNAGKGGRVQGNLSVLPGNELHVYVGGTGSDGSPMGAAGGYNGGGNAFFYFSGCAGAGGGATDIRIGDSTLTARKVVAGGGGGSSIDGSPRYGGAGGGLTGGNGEANDGFSSARGGTQIAGGAGATYAFWTAGSNGALGMGGNGSTQGFSGGGGGGYYGGGGGIWTGGAGGSSYTDGGITFSNTHTQGVNEGNGVAKIYYVNPGTYDIIWDAAADAAGFVNVAEAALPTTEFNIAVPELVAPGTYHATLRVRNYHGSSTESCEQSYPIEVTVKPLPTVDNPGDYIVCHGEAVPDITFSGPLSGSNYNWVNDNPAIGLDAAGSGHTTTFLPINGTPLPVSAQITVTPVADGCIGTAEVFNIIDNPVPALNSTTTPASICNNSLFSYLPTSLTPGTSFEWSRSLTPGIANAANSGTGLINETLINTSTEPVTVAYVYTLTANSCSNVQTVNVLVNPTPQLTSTLTPTAVCNGDAFVYTPLSLSSTAVITWTRPVAAGISNAAATGTGVINETLNNTTTTPKTVHYAIEMNVGGCIETEDVAVVINPLLLLTSPTSRNVCDSALLEYLPVSNITTAAITWTRPAVTGLSNAAGSGTGNISERLYDTTVNPVTVNYTYTLSAFGCSKDHTLAVTVKPSPKLTTSLTPGAVCTNSLFNYVAASATAGTTFQWARDTVVGITNPTVHVLNGTINEILISTSDTILNVPYKFTSTAGGCSNAQIVNVKVNPLPRIANDSGNVAVCDSTLLSWVPTSKTPGATYAWSRAYEAGISNLPSSGTGGAPGERLNNTTYITVPVTYVYTITANGCSNTQSVEVKVRPSAILTSNTATVCSGAPFNYVPVSYTTGTSFAWSRTGNTGIVPTSRSGAGNIVDTLTQSTSGKVTITYNMDLTVFGCVNKQNVILTLDPAPTPITIGTHPSASLCNNATAVNFGAASPAADGFTYMWSAEGATVTSTGSSTQYALINFNTPGTATVTLTTKNTATTCTSTSTYTVTVGNNVAVSPEVIFFDGQFICKQTEVKNYQWGYDDAATLDSTVAVGETNQNYAVQFPEWGKKFYWVITTTADGCMQKTYFNKPTGVADLNLNAADMRLYPNPASQTLNMEVSSFVNGKITFAVFNVVGQQITTVDARDNKAQVFVADLPAGVYVVDCYNDGVKVAAARFIKN